MAARSLAFAAMFLLALAVASAQQLSTPTTTCVTSFDSLSAAQQAMVESCLTQTFSASGTECVERCVAFSVAQLSPICAPNTNTPIQLCASACVEYQLECGAPIDCSSFSTDATLCVSATKPSISALLSDDAADDDVESDADGESGSDEDDDVESDADGESGSDADGSAEDDESGSDADGSAEDDESGSDADQDEDEDEESWRPPKGGKPPKGDKPPKGGKGPRASQSAPNGGDSQRGRKGRPHKFAVSAASSVSAAAVAVIAAAVLAAVF